MSGFAQGGYVAGDSRHAHLLTLDPDECVLDRDLRCQRTDDAHHFQMIEAPRRLHERDGRVIRGRCLHRHKVAVESGGQVVAHLCLRCDAQLP